MNAKLPSILDGLAGLANLADKQSAEGQEFQEAFGSLKARLAENSRQQLEDPLGVPGGILDNEQNRKQIEMMKDTDVLLERDILSSLIEKRKITNRHEELIAKEYSSSMTDTLVHQLHCSWRVEEAISGLAWEGNQLSHDNDDDSDSSHQGQDKRPNATELPKDIDDTFLKVNSENRFSESM